MKLKKGSEEAKRFMAKIRAKKGKTKKISGIKKTLRKKTPTKKHTDINSHNYNISISGINKIAKEKLNKVVQDINKMETALNKNIATAKLTPYKTPFWKKQLTKNRKKIKNFITELKKHKTELKKLL
jgi:hypothetical protein